LKTKILYLTCTFISIIVSLLSWWIIESSKGAYMGMIGEFYGSVGMVIASVLAIVGIVSGVICIRRNKKANEISSSHNSLSMEGVSIATCICSLLIVIATVWMLRF